MSPKSPFRFSWRLVAIVLLVAAGVGLAFAFNPQRRATVHLERGKLYLRQKRLEAAQHEFERSFALAPPAWEAQYYQAEILAQTGQGTPAVELWLSLRASPVAARALAAAAEQARRDGDTELALDTCAEALRAGHSPVPFLAVEARILHADGRLQEAAARYRDALALNPHRVDLISELATAYTDAGQPEDAVALLTETLAALPETSALEVQLAELHKRAHRYDEALALYRRVVARDPHLLGARVAFLEQLMVAEAWAEVEAEATALLAEPKAAAMAHFALGRVTYRRADYGEALEHLQAAASQLPQDRAVLLWLARAQRQRGAIPAALASYRAAAAKEHQEVTVRMELLHALWEAGEFAEAQQRAGAMVREPADADERVFLQQVRASAQEQWELLDLPQLLDMAQAALHDRRFDDARRAGTVAQRRAPDDPRPFVPLALVAMAQGDVRTALGYLYEGGQRAPGNAAVAINRARLLQGLGHRGRALSTLTAALGAEDAEAGPLLTETLPLLFAQGRAAEVEALIRRHAPAPHTDELATALARALLLQDRAEEALQAVDGVTTRAAAVCRGRALLALRRDAEARTVLATLHRMDPGPAVTAVGTLLFGADPEAWPQRAPGAVYPLERAAALAGGNTGLRETVADDSGRLGATLGLLALVRAGESADAATWQAARFGGGSDLAANVLPPDPAAFAAALVCQVAGWPAAAMRFYADAGAVDHPVFAEAVAQCALGLGRREQAMRLMARATASQVPLVPLRARYAMLLWTAGDHGAARAAVAAGLALTPEAAPLLTLAAELALQEGDRVQAIARYRAAVAAGGGPQVHNSLAWLLAQDDASLPEALELAQAADAATPYSAAVVDTLGWCYLRLGRPEQAVYYTNLAVLLDPADVQVRAHRAEALLAGGWPEAARRDCETLRGLLREGGAATDDLLTICDQFGV